MCYFIATKRKLFIYMLITVANVILCSCWESSFYCVATLPRLASGKSAATQTVQWGAVMCLNVIGDGHHTKKVTVRRFDRPVGEIIESEY